VDDQVTEFRRVLFRSIKKWQEYKIHLVLYKLQQI
jgi:hypothetical protein